jgi:hypothetical protein
MLSFLVGALILAGAVVVVASFVRRAVPGRLLAPDQREWLRDNLTAAVLLALVLWRVAAAGY